MSKTSKYNIWLSLLKKFLDTKFLYITLKGILTAVVAYALLLLFRVVLLKISGYLGSSWSGMAFEIIHTVFTLYAFAFSCWKDTKKIVRKNAKNNTKKRHK
jgi:hypothetical protein